MSRDDTHVEAGLVASFFTFLKTQRSEHSHAAGSLTLSLSIAMGVVHTPKSGAPPSFPS